MTLKLYDRKTMKVRILYVMGLHSFRMRSKQQYKYVKLPFKLSLLWVIGLWRSYSPSGERKNTLVELDIRSCRATSLWSNVLFIMYYGSIFMQALDVYIHMSVKLWTSVSCESHSRGTTNYAGAIFLTSREENRHHGILVSDRKIAAWGALQSGCQRPPDCSHFQVVIVVYIFSVAF